MMNIICAIVMFVCKFHYNIIKIQIMLRYTINSYLKLSLITILELSNFLYRFFPCIRDWHRAHILNFIFDPKVFSTIVKQVKNS